MIPKRNIKAAFKKATKQPAYAMRAFMQRARSFMAYHFKDGYSSYPETISLFLTYRCNLRCDMCGQWGADGSSWKLTPETLKAELTLDELKSIINNVKLFSPNITLFGGEPLLYREWTELVRYIKEAKLRCNIITNATLLEKYAKDAVHLGVDEIIFSLDGPREIHDSIRGAEGIFDKAYRGLKAVNTWRKELQCNVPHINISSTIFETNYLRMNEIVDIAEDLSASSVTFHHLIFLSREIFERHNEMFRGLFTVTCQDWAGFVRNNLPNIDVEKLIANINNLKKRESQTSILFYPNLTEEEIRRYYTNFDFRPSSYKHRCVSPWMVAYIFPDGSVRPCQSLNFVAGNVREDSFKNIWNNQKYLRFRRVTKENRLYPVCYRCTELYRF